MEKSDLIALANLIAKTFSPSVETIVHDLKKPGFPIIAIFNNVLSGREVGDSSHIFGDNQNLDNLPNHVINYPYKSPNNRLFRSSSIIFRNKRGKPEFALSINFDTTPIKAVIDTLSILADHVPPEINLESSRKKEFLSNEDLKNWVSQILMSHNSKSGKLKPKEIQSIVAILSQTGYFNHHGSVSILSEALGVTRPTIYNHLHKIKQKPQ